MLPVSSFFWDSEVRVLNIEDLNHYRRVVAALGDITRLTGKLDEAIEKSGGWPLK